MLRGLCRVPPPPLVVRRLPSLLLAAAALSLCGCLDTHGTETITLKPDGSGAIRVELKPPTPPNDEKSRAKLQHYLPPGATASYQAGRVTVLLPFKDSRELSTRLKGYEALDPRIDFSVLKRDECMNREYVVSANRSPFFGLRIIMPGKTALFPRDQAAADSLFSSNTAPQRITVRSLDAIPLHPSLSVWVGTLGTRVELKMLSARADVRTRPWGTAAWEACQRRLRETYRDWECLPYRQEPEGEGLRFTRSLHGLGHASGRDGRFFGVSLGCLGQPFPCAQQPTTKDGRSAKWRPITTISRRLVSPLTMACSYKAILPSVKGTAFEGVLSRGDVKLALPWRIISSNAAGRDRLDPTCLVWQVALDQGSTIEVTYVRTAWEVIGPGSLGLVLALVMLRRRRRGRRAWVAATAQSKVGS